MFCPTNARASVARLTQRNKNKHRRLFDGGEGALKVSQGNCSHASLIIFDLIPCYQRVNKIISSYQTHTHTPPSDTLQDGEIVSYTIHGVKLLTGTVVIPEKGASGIRCDHCNHVFSCSAFENHAGHGQRRNPYDGITTSEGLTLRWEEVVKRPIGRVVNPSL